MFYHALLKLNDMFACLRLKRKNCRLSNIIFHIYNKYIHIHTLLDYINNTKNSFFPFCLYENKEYPIMHYSFTYLFCYHAIQ